MSDPALERPPATDANGMVEACHWEHFEVCRSRAYCRPGMAVATHPCVRLEFRRMDVLFHDAPGLGTPSSFNLRRDPPRRLAVREQTEYAAYGLRLLPMYLPLA